jgi:hypothetical protein
MITKRVLVVVLWGYAFWYLGAMLSAFGVLPALAGPGLGVAAAIFAGYRFAGLRPGIRAVVSRPAPAPRVAPRRSA